MNSWPTLFPANSLRYPIMQRFLQFITRNHLSTGDFRVFVNVFFVHAFDHVTILTNHFTPIILNYYLHFRQCKQHLGPNIWAVLCERYYRNLFEDLFLLKWFCHSYLTNEWLFLNPKLWTPHWIWKVDIFGEKEKECDSQPYH